MAWIFSWTTFLPCKHAVVTFYQFTLQALGAVYCSLETGHIYTHNYLTTFWGVVFQGISFYISIHYNNHPQ